MRIRGLIVLAASFILSGLGGKCFAGADPSILTANELAEALGVRWWVFRVPADIKPGDMLCVHWVTSTGSGVGFAVGVNKPGECVKIFYRETESAPVVNIETANGAGSGGVQLPDGFVCGSSGGPGNGAEMKNGDLLLKLEKKVPNNTYTNESGNNTLKPNEIGLKVEIQPAGQ